MDFNSLNFLFIFLPLFAIIYLITDTRYKNLVALAASLIFFSWGQIHNLPLMVVLILVNFYLGKAIEVYRVKSTTRARIFLIFGCVYNLSILLFFKAFIVYGSSWSFLPADILSRLKENPLPLGLSYITFQVISYLFDIYREMCDSEKNFLHFSLYILLFPKILVGPIERYRNLAGQLSNREVDWIRVANGLRRFVMGLGKKALIADTIAQSINPAFSLTTPNFSTGIAWFVLFGYAIQLYFDFSGYTDMAIGLGQILGFKFMENFNYPYISKSVTDFWRRWHISLASWFRDYVFYPLELMRRKSKIFSQQLNVFIVFILLGLWHGLTFNYIIWGGIHGLALVFELKSLKKIKTTWIPVQHIYALSVILCGWVFFRTKTVDYAIQFFGRLFGSQQGLTPLPFSITQPLPIIDHTVWIALAAGILFSMPILPFLQKKWSHFIEGRPVLRTVGQLGADVIILLIGILSIAAITNMGVAASIYGGF
jgi:alginate O-acetyltransferase complex protein AlgI